MDNLPSEEWRPVVGFEGYYEVSSMGRVRSLHNSNRWGTRRILSPHNGGNGYAQAELHKEGLRQKRRVHHLVAEAFIGPRPSHLDVNHLDGVKTNNRVGNLEYATRSANMKHAIALGLSNPHPPDSSILEGWQVKAIRHLYDRFVPQKQLAAWFDVSVSTISGVITGATHKAVE